MSHSKFIKPIKLRNVNSDSAIERKVTWTELFFDLIFVVVISEIATNLYAQTTVRTLLQFCLLFISVWYGWLANTFYCDRFDTDSLFHRVLYVLQMLFVACLAAHAYLAFSLAEDFFVWIYVLFRGITIILYIDAYVEVRHARRFVSRYIFFYTSVVLLWALSLFFSSNYRYVFWVVAVLLDITTPFWVAKEFLEQQAKVSSGHLQERFGLFTLIVIGETIASIVNGMRTHAFGLHSMSIALLGLLAIFSVWWIYYDDESVIPERKSFILVCLWEYSHLFLMLGISIFGVCIRHAFMRHYQFLMFEKFIFFSSFSVILLSLVSIDLASHFSKRKKNTLHLNLILARLIFPIIILSMLFVVHLLTPFTSIIILTIISILQIFYAILT